ncbi:MAG TPA: hypothetical protein VKV16_05470 [Solirubrobacteraceae bacterium]|nr:hypothetical protein [Solirubrobacteraceae bacterium]
MPGAPSAALEADARVIAGALRSLADAPRPWPPDAIEAVSASLRELLAGLPPRAADGSAIVASAVRRAAEDLLLLLPRGAPSG